MLVVATAVPPLVVRSKGVVVIEGLLEPEDFEVALRNLSMRVGQPIGVGRGVGRKGSRYAHEACSTDNGSVDSSPH